MSKSTSAGDKLRVESSGVSKEIALPDYGEVKIVCVDGKVKFIETTVKEKMD